MTKIVSMTLVKNKLLQFKKCPVIMNPMYLISKHLVLCFKIKWGQITYLLQISEIPYLYIRCAAETYRMKTHRYQDISYNDI